jgi:hypothetical protein
MKYDPICGETEPLKGFLCDYFIFRITRKMRIHGNLLQECRMIYIQEITFYHFEGFLFILVPKVLDEYFYCSSKKVFSGKHLTVSLDLQ